MRCVWRIEIFAIATMCVAAWGCDGKQLSGPPELRLGRDECRECGMIISEDRYSSAMLVERDGRREYALFDDIGCLLDWQRESLNGITLHEQFVHDYATRRWIPAAAATYLLADPRILATPMSSGMAAFSTREQSESALSEHGGEIVDFDGLKAARKTWDEKRRGQPGK